MAWSTVLGLAVAVGSAAAFLFMVWRLMSSLTSSQLESARRGDALAAEQAGHAETRRMLAATRESYAHLRKQFSEFARRHIAAATDDEAIRLAGGDAPPAGVVLADGLLDPFSDGRPLDPGADLPPAGGSPPPG